MTINSTIDLGNLLAGIGAILVAVAAWVTLYIVDLKANQRAWYEGFRELYSEFWNDPTLIVVRTWIATEPGYEAFLPVLKKRLASQIDVLDTEEYRQLDLLDRFCALIIRVTLFGQQRMSRAQRVLYERTFEQYWIRKMESRPEMAEYIRRLWGAYFFDKVS